jgi:16S rRNA (guanine966-N2)-methyltransferase
MRITGGRLKGRSLKVPKSDLIRPTTDRVRESLFAVLENLIDFEGLTVCDVYAGSGSLGFESYSRGAGKIHFVEKNYVIYKNLYKNIETLGLKEKCKVFKTEAVKFSRMKNHEAYDLILADPPFYKYDVHIAVQNFLKNNFLKENGIIIVERSVQTEKKDVEAFERKAFKKIGDSLIYLFKKPLENLFTGGEAK